MSAEPAIGKRKDLPRWYWVFMAVVLVLLVFIMLVPRQDAPAKRPTPEGAAGQQAPSAEAKAAALEKQKGMHCLSAWDGSNRSTVEQVKTDLRNPDSFQHAETTITPRLANGMHALRMKYRAENGFGGMNVETAVAAVEHESCEATLITSVEQMEALLPAP